MCTVKLPSQHADVFDVNYTVKAFHVKWAELPLDPNVKKWSVHILNLDRVKRHLDRATIQMFWEVLDK